MHQSGPLEMTPLGTAVVMEDITIINSIIIDAGIDCGRCDGMEFGCWASIRGRIRRICKGAIRGTLNRLRTAAYTHPPLTGSLASNHRTTTKEVFYKRNNA